MGFVGTTANVKGIKMIKGGLNGEIRAALLGAAGTHQGSQVPAQTRAVAGMLRELGIVGPGGGLTRRGSALAESVRRAAEEVAFS